MIRLHDEKTGKLFTASLLIGATMAWIEDPQTLEQLRWFWVLLGRAFQIRDDILDYEGTPDELGKAIWKDGHKGIVSFMGIEKAKKLLQDLEYNLLETANTYQTSKFSDIVSYVAERAK
jgi:geranylgeranyl pyrophosphate synthase